MKLRLSEDVCLELLDIYWDKSLTGLALLNAEGKFTAANPTFCRIVKYTEAELRMKHFRDITHPKDVAADEEMSRLVAEGKEDGYDMTKDYITKDNYIQPVQLRVTALKMNEQFMYFVAEVAAVERRQMEPNVPAPAKQALMWRWMRDYWVQITFVLTLLAGLVAQATGGMIGGQ